MGKFPKSTRAAAVKCVSCNAPAVRTVEEEFICVECGGEPLSFSDQVAARDGD